MSKAEVRQGYTLSKPTPSDTTPPVKLQLPPQTVPPSGVQIPKPMGDIPHSSHSKQALGTAYEAWLYEASLRQGKEVRTELNSIADIEKTVEDLELMNR